MLTVQGLVQRLSDYGVPEGNIIGVRSGFNGFHDRYSKPVRHVGRFNGLHDRYSKLVSMGDPADLVAGKQTGEHVGLH